MVKPIPKLQLRTVETVKKNKKTEFNKNQVWIIKKAAAQQTPKSKLRTVLCFLYKLIMKGLPHKKTCCSHQKQIFINTPDSFSTPTGGERVTLGCLNGC